MASLSAIPVRADDLVGQASAIDGDTIEIHGNRIRLLGIDLMPTQHFLLVVFLNGLCAKVL